MDDQRKDQTKRREPTSASSAKDEFGPVHWFANVPGCHSRPMTDTPWGAISRHTRLVFERALAQLPFRDGQDWADVRKGRLADLPPALSSPAAPLADLPDEALHPSLQRIRDLRAVRGLFAVVPGVWQIRNGWRNVTVVAGDQGRLLIDPPREQRLSEATLRLLDEVLGPQPVTAVLHSAVAAQQGIGMSVIDGVVIESLPVVPDGAEPDGELLRWFPQHGMLHTAGAVAHTLPSVSVEGRTADPLARAKALHRALTSYRDELSVVVGAQDWPTWGSSRSRQVLADGRDLLRYLHDEVLRLAAAGAGVEEVLAGLQLPPTLTAKWQVRGYDATLADYAAMLLPRRAEEASGSSALSAASEARLVHALGSAIEPASVVRTALDEGDYRAAAELGEMLLRVEPTPALGEITAQAYQQLAFQEENLVRYQRFTTRSRSLAGDPAARAAAPLMPCRAEGTAEELFDLLAVRLHGPRAAGDAFSFPWRVDDDEEQLLSLRNGVLFAVPVDAATTIADVEVASSREVLGAIACGHRDAGQALHAGDLRVTGDLHLFERFTSLLVAWSCAATGGVPLPDTTRQETP